MRKSAAAEPMLMVTSCRPKGRSSNRAKPRRYSKTSLAEGIARLQTE